MKYCIAGVAWVEQFGKPLPRDAEVALNSLLSSLLEKISVCTDLNAAEDLLDQLGRFQTELAKACFEWDVSVSPRLRMFVREFDRSDDPDLRAHVFDSIKRGEFCIFQGS